MHHTRTSCTMLQCVLNHGGEPLRRVLAYTCKRYVLAILNATCMHILVVNKHMWMYIMVSTDFQLLHHIVSVRIRTNAI